MKTDHPLPWSAVLGGLLNDPSPEGLSKGFTHIWIVKFKDAKARDAYLIHPAHVAFVEILKPILDEPLVVDFIPQK